jgi:hypothetical protein
VIRLNKPDAMDVYPSRRRSVVRKFEIDTYFYCTKGAHRLFKRNEIRTMIDVLRALLK